MSTLRISHGARGLTRTLLPHLRELAIVASAYWVYMYTRALVFDDFSAIALSNAGAVISLEKSFGIFWEPHWQAWAMTSAENLVIFFNWVYIVTFWPILLTTGFILYLANRRRYWYYRNVVLLSFTFALLAFALFPLAPPRMIADHFVDTIKAFGPAFYASREFANFYNPYAAMPSLHFSWTLMFGILLLRTPNKLLKALGVLYPAMTLLAITITANHYIADAIGGALLAFSAFATFELGFRRRLSMPRVFAYLAASRHRLHIAFIQNRVIQKRGVNSLRVGVVPLLTSQVPGRGRDDELGLIGRHGDPSQ